MSAAVGGHEMFRADELVSAIRGRLVAGRADRAIDAISTDTRRLPPGALFWALRGERFDGAAFVEEALAKGACGAVVPADAVPDARVWQGRDVVLIAAGDPLRALQEAAAAHRARFERPVVGVTGSNGKTTTKEMTAAILAQRGPVLKTEGNLNNHIGVPLTLFRLGAEHRAAVVELGINHPGEMTRLCEIARPTVGVITNVGHAHLEGFGDLDGVARTAQAMDQVAAGIIFTNLVDLDSKYGHRNDPAGYARDLEAIDAALPEVLRRAGEADLLVITADHGNDPTTPSTDHSREYTPLLLAGPRIRAGVDVGVRETFADVGATVAAALDIPWRGPGSSLLGAVAARTSEVSQE